MPTSPNAREELAHVRIVRELGARNPGTYLGKREDQRDIVLETYAGLDPKSWRLVFDSAQRLAASPKHPHIVSVIAADRIGGSISIVTDYVDGLPLEEVFFDMSVGARLRAIVDVLSALSALHMVPDGTPIVHGGILLRSAFVEKTGRTKLGFAYRHALCVKKESYAPEVLLGDEAAIDARSDVYGAGALLWEAIAGHALFGDAKPEDLVRKELAGPIARPNVAARDKWASTVLPVIERALAIDPHRRWASIAEMAAALRIAVRARLMTHDDVIEELWPAETKPKHSSGIIPAAPIIADATPQAPESKSELIATPPPVATPIVSMEPAPIAEGAASGIVPVAEPKPIALPQRAHRGRTFVVIALAACFIAVVVVTLAHFRGSRVDGAAAGGTPQTAKTARASATPEERPVAAEKVERAAVEHEDTSPTIAPAAGGTTAPTTTAAPLQQQKGKPGKRLPKTRGTYDPSTI